MIDIDQFKCAFAFGLHKENLTGSFDDDKYARMYEAFVADMEAGMPFVQAITCALYHNTTGEFK